MGWREERTLYMLFLVLVIYTIHLSYKVYSLQGLLESHIYHHLARPGTLSVLSTDPISTATNSLRQNEISLSPTTPVVDNPTPKNQPPSPTDTDTSTATALLPPPVLPLLPSPPANFQSVLQSKSPPPQVPPKQEKAVSRDVHSIIYGGVIDLPHLGGFTKQDNNTISPNAWNFLVSDFAIKSMIDVGCGRGTSAKHFLDRGVDVLCVEGSHDAIEHTHLPRDRIVQHDFSLGAWWPNGGVKTLQRETYDLAWSTEFLEHVSRQYMDHYMPVFMRSALVMITTSGWGGWHHVEVHAPWWWIARFTARGFIYSRELSEIFRYQVDIDLARYKQGMLLQAGLLVFINPYVASLPQHKHLFGGKGCHLYAIDNRDGGAHCTGVDALPKEYLSLIDCKKPSTTVQFNSTPWECVTADTGIPVPGIL